MTKRWASAELCTVVEYTQCHTSFHVGVLPGQAGGYSFKLQSTTAKRDSATLRLQLLTISQTLRLREKRLGADCCYVDYLCS